MRNTPTEKRDHVSARNSWLKLADVAIPMSTIHRICEWELMTIPRRCRRLGSYTTLVTQCIQHALARYIRQPQHTVIERMHEVQEITAPDVCYHFALSRPSCVHRALDLWYCPENHACMVREKTRAARRPANGLSQEERDDLPPSGA